METEGSSPHSQAHATCPYPELAPSSPHTHIPLPEDPSQYYPPIYVLVSPMAPFPQASPPPIIIIIIIIISEQEGAEEHVMTKERVKMRK